MSEQTNDALKAQNAKLREALVETAKNAESIRDCNKRLQCVSCKNLAEAILVKARDALGGGE